MVERFAADSPVKAPARTKKTPTTGKPAGKNAGKGAAKSAKPAAKKKAGK